MERQEITALVALDLSVAFDTVDHSVLLNVLHNQFGITGNALNWYNTYLRPPSMLCRDHWIKVIVQND